MSKQKILAEYKFQNIDGITYKVELSYHTKNGNKCNNRGGHKVGLKEKLLSILQDEFIATYQTI